jgi:hypothetical protein
LESSISVIAGFFRFMCPRIFNALHDADEWNSGYVRLAMAGFALSVAAVAARAPSRS